MKKNILSLKGPHPLKNDYKKSLKLTQFQRNIIVGTLLGDAHLESKGLKPTYRYYFSQKESQKSYVYHIYSFFENWCSTEPQYANSGLSIKQEITKFVYFRSCTHNAFEFYAKQFYNLEKKKIIPKLLHKWLNPQVLAYWYMDDGCKDTYGYLLNTQNFSFLEQQKLAEALGRKFKFEINIHKDRDNYRLYITSKSRNSFTKIVKPFILPSFEYKLFL